MKRKIRFIDCGANIGQSIDWARKVFLNDDLKIDSFEPLPKNIEVLKKRYESGAVFEDEELKILIPCEKGYSVYHSLVIHEGAVSNQEGTATFYCQDWGARTGSSLVKGKTSTTGGDTVEVKTFNLKKWIDENVGEDEIPVLKVDIEGAEYDLLPHLIKGEVHKKIDYWLVEFHGDKVSNCDVKVEELLRDNVKYLFDWNLDMDVVENQLREIGFLE